MNKLSKQQRAGFSLIEIMVSTTILGITFSALLSGFVFTSKSTYSLSNYSEMLRQSTFFLETFAREVRMAEDINYFQANAFSMEVAFADGSQTVEYEYLPDSKNLIRRVNGIDRTMLSDVNWLNFKFFNVLNAETNTLLEVKSVQMEAGLQKNVMKIMNTDHIVSARFMMRNRTISN